MFRKKQSKSSHEPDRLTNKRIEKEKGVYVYKFLLEIFYDFCIKFIRKKKHENFIAVCFYAELSVFQFFSFTTTHLTLGKFVLKFKNSILKINESL